jgi:hypothetical protein
VFNKSTSGHVIIRVSAANLACVNAPLGSLIPTKPFLSESCTFALDKKKRAAFLLKVLKKTG